MDFFGSYSVPGAWSITEGKSSVELWVMLISWPQCKKTRETGQVDKHQKQQNQDPTGLHRCSSEKPGCCKQIWLASHKGGTKLACAHPFSAGRPIEPSMVALSIAALRSHHFLKVSVPWNLDKSDRSLGIGMEDSIGWRCRLQLENSASRNLI